MSRPGAVMRKRLIVGFVVAACAAGVAVALWTRDTRPKLLPAAEADGAAVIAVGQNIRISAALPLGHHAGCTITADPTQASRLFAASMRTPADGRSAVVGYGSDDGGATWQLAVERLPGSGERCCDESVASGPDGALYLAHMRGPADGPKPSVIARSVDG